MIFFKLNVLFNATEKKTKKTTDKLVEQLEDDPASNKCFLMRGLKQFLMDLTIHSITATRMAIFGMPAKNLYVY